MNRDVELDEKLIRSLLTHTESLMNHVFWFQHDLSLQPSKRHVGSSINFTDIQCRKDDFLRELVFTITDWVYSKARVEKIVQDRLRSTSGCQGNASAFLQYQSFSKFRAGYPQGQFGELLLFNFLQHFFRAVPLLRKMRITTSRNHERFGSDAIHVKLENNSHVFVLGESKCYESKYKFNSAFEASLTSIVSTFNSLDSELNLYTYDDFIEKELESLAIRYKRGELRGVHFELVCLIAYNETNKIDGENEQEIKDSISSIIHNRCKDIDPSSYNKIEGRLLNRINYIIFPVWDLDKVLDEFSNLIGAR